ncbi:MAG TPA: CDP-alcohol phosphatidyltransferase family protein [Blastocatellia bacterium]
MASIYDLKPRFQNLLRPLAPSLTRLGVTPNLITWAALIGSISAGSLVWLAGDRAAVMALLPAWLLIRMALNALDGMIARECRMVTSRGAALNELGDLLSDLALYLPLAYLRAAALWPVIAFVFGAALTEFCGVLGQALGGRRVYDGPMGKSDRAAFIGALALLTLVAPQVIGVWPWIFTLAALLTLLTCRNRLSHALRENNIEST